MIASPRAVSVVRDKSRSPQTVSKWVSYLNNNEPDLMEMIGSIASHVSATMNSIVNNTGRLPVGDLVNSVINTSVITVMAIVAGANDIGLSKANIDSLTGASNNADREYSNWLDGILPDVFYDVKMYTAGIEPDSNEWKRVVAAVTDSDDWGKAVAAHEEYIRKQKNLSTKSAIIASLPETADSAQDKIVDKQISNKQIKNDNVNINI
jgi:hypothetical protein